MWQWVVRQRLPPLYDEIMYSEYTPARLINKATLDDFSGPEAMAGFTELIRWTE